VLGRERARQLASFAAALDAAALQMGLFLARHAHGRTAAAAYVVILHIYFAALLLFSGAPKATTDVLGADVAAGLQARMAAEVAAAAARRLL
jgi:hypothetical protein